MQIVACLLITEKLSFYKEPLQPAFHSNCIFILQRQHFHVEGNLRKGVNQVKFHGLTALSTLY